jgi:outer membrane protein insertion porin family/translocation and assembly module TamA
LIGTKRNPDQRTGDLLLAGRTKLGFLLLADYGHSLRGDNPGDECQGLTDQALANCEQTSASDQQKLLSRAFYSGGANSDRGYPERAISPTGPIDFLLPPSIQALCHVDPSDPRCTRPLGGFTQWEASLELRYAGLYPLGLAVFVDAADVSRSVGNLQFRYPHISVGPGLRYETPVGPIRLDIGIRVPGAQAWGQSTLPLSHGQEPSPLLGLPASIHLAIGDAFPTGDTF